MLVAQIVSARSKVKMNGAGRRVDIDGGFGDDRIMIGVVVDGRRRPLIDSPGQVDLPEPARADLRNTPTQHIRRCPNPREPASRGWYSECRKDWPDRESPRRAWTSRSARWPHRRHKNSCPGPGWGCCPYRSPSRRRRPTDRWTGSFRWPARTRSRPCGLR